MTITPIPGSSLVPTMPFIREILFGESHSRCRNSNGIMGHLGSIPTNSPSRSHPRFHPISRRSLTSRISAETLGFALDAI